MHHIFHTPLQRTQSLLTSSTHTNILKHCSHSDLKKILKKEKKNGLVFRCMIYRTQNPGYKAHTQLFMEDAHSNLILTQTRYKNWVSVAPVSKSEATICSAFRRVRASISPHLLNEHSTVICKHTQKSMKSHQDLLISADTTLKTTWFANHSHHHY